MRVARSSPGRSVRAFMAVDSGPDIRAELGPVVAELKRLNAAVRWVAAENWHLTVKFLGDVDWRRIGEISQALQQEAAAVPAFELTVHGLQAFPPGPKARIVAAEIRAGFEGLKSLHQALDRRMQEFGVLAESRAFLAHLTLGRVQGTQGLERLWQALAAHADHDFGSVAVDEVILFQSELKPQGPEYIPLARVKLKTA